MQASVRPRAFGKALGAAAIPFALLAAGCDRANAPGADNAAAPATADELLQAAEENAAVLAQDEELANDAAADEAADLDMFGGNAAAGDAGNGS